MAQLAHSEADSRYAFANGWSFAQRCAIQLGHSKMSTTLEVYTPPIPVHLREGVENLSRMVTSSAKKRRNCLPPSNDFKRIDGRPERARTVDLHRVKVAL
jgi:hypothetical protein